MIILVKNFQSILYRKKVLILKVLLLTNCVSTTYAQDSTAPEAAAAEDTLSFWDLPDLKEAYIDTTPTNRNDGILVGELGVDSGKKDMIVKLAQEIAEGKYGNYDGLLISHENKLVFESYYKKGRVNLAHGQASATKGHTSVILGRAIQLGYLTMADLDKPLVHFLKDLDPTKFVEGADKITLHKALTMHGGLSIDDDLWEELEKDTARLKGQGLVQMLLENSGPITSASQVYLYGNFNPMLVMTVIDAVVPGTAEDFIKNELLDKMGISNYEWQRHASGLPQAGWMVSMTSRDMLKWASLVLNKGKWNGEQLISADYLARATSGLVKPTVDWMPEVYRYGYFWYHTPVVVGNESYAAKFAWGGGGQYIIVVEDLDLTVVITGHDREDEIMTQVVETIIPAFAKNEFPLLEGSYFGQKPPGLEAEVFAPGIVSTELYELFGAFTPDMKEFYFVRYDENDKSSMVLLKSQNNQWRKSITGPRVGEPSISFDGQIMYLGNRFMERTDSGWSQLKSLGSPYSEFDIMRLTASSNGTYYFDTMGEEPIQYSRLVNGKREEPQKLDLDLGIHNAHPWIAPDESYLIWDDQRESGYGKADIYISFKQQDGSWGPAINMGGKINTEKGEIYATITPDGKYMLFNRSIDENNVDLYWVDAKIIETLRLQN